jgi:hypothetical protein
MRKTLKFFHTLASCGIIGALLGYAIILTSAPQDTPAAYANIRQTISLLCDLLLFPSLAIALITGLVSMAVHRPFQERRWVWAKAFLGLGMFQSTLAIIGSKADYAATMSTRLSAGDGNADALQRALTYEWYTLGTILALSLANIVLGVWRPPLKMRQRSPSKS